MKKYIFIIIVCVSFIHASLIRPNNGNQISSLYILFEWHQLPRAVSYNIQISTSAEFSENIKNISNSTTLYIEKQDIDWETTYYWRVRPIFEDSTNGEWSDIYQFSTLTPKVGTFQIESESSDLLQPGLTIFGSDNITLVFDSSGKEIWNDGDLEVMLNYIGPTGQMYGYSNINWPNWTGVEYSFFNVPLWRGPNDLYIDEHEIKQIPNKNYMGFTNVAQMGPITPGDWTFLYRALGYEADGVTIEYPWIGKKLVEWDQYTREEVWSWNPFDYFTIEDVDIYGDSWWLSWLFYDGYDWMHSNAFYFDENENAIYMSHRHLSRITKIAYPEGNVIWMMGPPCPYIASCEEHICSELGFSYQHNIEMLDNGNLIFFDNGNISETFRQLDQPISRVLEVDVVGDSICEVIWEYDLPPDLYGDAQGGVQRLPNGNYLICTVGSGGALLEVNTSQELLATTHIERMNGGGIFPYRAYRIPSIYPSAFSLILHNLDSFQESGVHYNMIDLTNTSNTVSFSIYNESGFTQKYLYNVTHGLSELTLEIDTLEIDPYTSISIEVPIIELLEDSLHLNLEVFPIDHPYDKKSIQFFVNTSILELSEVEPEFELQLYNAYPNPFNPISSIDYKLPQPDFVNITIFDMMGRVIRKLVSDYQSSGYQSVSWNGTNDLGQSVSAGVYLFTLDVGGIRKTKKIIYLK